MKTSLRYFKTIPFIALIIFSTILPSCNSSRRTQGTIIGAAVGAATGAVAAKKNRAAAILLGASIGGVAGNLIGQYMDKQAEEIRRDLEGAKVERIGEGIVVTFDSGLLFDFDSDALRQSTRENLAQLATTLKKYDDTEVIIFGHTDSIGDTAYNRNLSERRADSVENYLTGLHIDSQRLEPQGMGESDPLASNDTEEGRQLNRRVEVTIMANKKLIRDAKKGDIPQV
ncbi:MAG: OmpA family protein [Saprospiraceae bacterium]|nr:OmpA family protein [Saprospiraceae bacterium]